MVKKNTKEYEAVTIALLRVRSEMYTYSRSGDFDVETFDREYLNGIGEYERELADREGIVLRDFESSNINNDVGGRGVV